MAQTTTTLTLVAFGGRSKTAHLCHDGGDEWRPACDAPARAKKGSRLFEDNKLPAGIETCIMCQAATGSKADPDTVAAARAPSRSPACRSHGKVNCKKCASPTGPAKGTGMQPEAAPPAADYGPAVPQHKEDLEVDVCETDGVTIEDCRPEAHKAWHDKRRRAKVKDAVGALDPVAAPLKDHADAGVDVFIEEREDPGTGEPMREVPGPLLVSDGPGLPRIDAPAAATGGPPPALDHHVAGEADLNDTTDGALSDAPPLPPPRAPTPAPYRPAGQDQPRPAGHYEPYQLPLARISAEAAQALLRKVVEQERELATLRARFPSPAERKLLEKVLGRIFRGDKLDGRKPPYTEDERNLCAILYAKVAVPDARPGK